MVPADDGASPAPLDRAVLEHMRSRFAGRQMFESVDLIEEGKLYLGVELAGDYYPGDASARFEIRWYRNDDFTVHYQEERQESVWSVAGTATPAVTTNEITSIRHRTPVAPTQKTHSGLTTIVTSVSSSSSTSKSELKLCGNGSRQPSEQNTVPQIIILL